MPNRLVSLAAAAAALIALAIISPSRSLADTDPTPAPSPVPAPVQVVGTYMKQLNGNLQYSACVSFLNTSQKLITAVRFDFNLYNAFHESTAHYYGDRIGEFSPGVTIAGPEKDWQFSTSLANCFTFYSYGVAQTMVAKVQRVMFADGTEWNWPTPTPTPTP